MSSAPHASQPSWAVQSDPDPIGSDLSDIPDYSPPTDLPDYSPPSDLPDKKSKKQVIKTNVKHAIAAKSVVGGSPSGGSEGDPSTTSSDHPDPMSGVPHASQPSRLFNLILIPCLVLHMLVNIHGLFNLILIP